MLARDMGCESDRHLPYFMGGPDVGSLGSVPGDYGRSREAYLLASESVPSSAQNYFR